MYDSDIELCISSVIIILPLSTNIDVLISYL